VPRPFGIFDPSVERLMIRNNEAKPERRAQLRGMPSGEAGIRLLPWMRLSQPIWNGNVRDFAEATEASAQIREYESRVHAVPDFWHTCAGSMTSHPGFEHREICDTRPTSGHSVIASVYPLACALTVLCRWREALKPES
jgi:hypothetical protein